MVPETPRTLKVIGEPPILVIMASDAMTSVSALFEQRTIPLDVFESYSISQRFALLVPSSPRKERSEFKILLTICFSLILVSDSNSNEIYRQFSFSVGLTLNLTIFSYTFLDSNTAVLPSVFFNKFFWKSHNGSLCFSIAHTQDFCKCHHLTRLS